MTDNIIENGGEIRPFTWLERIKYLFTAPDKLFENLKTYPKSLFPVLVFIIGVILLNLLRIDLYKEFLIEVTQNQFAAQGMDVPENIENFVGMQIYFSLFAMAVTPLFVWIVKSAAVNGISLLMGGDGTYKQCFSAIVYAYFPVLLGQVVVTILSLIVGNFNILTSLAILLPNSMAGGPLYNLMAQFDIFIIWYQILAIIGVSHIYGISKKKASVPVLLSWLVWILITVGLGAVNSAMMGGM